MPLVKLVASLIVRNELSRYLEPCIGHLLEFCDEIRVLDDDSSDGWIRELGIAKDSRITVLYQHVPGRNERPDFHLHAEARNALLTWTLDAQPDYVLAIDADELVADGRAVRRACETGADVVTLEMAEVWEACDDLLCIRQDGGWRSHEIGCVWRAAAFATQALSLADKGHATGRVPDAVHRGRARPSGSVVYHFGWANRSERAERYKRYADGDGGKFHAAAHIQSIMWNDGKVECEARPWPEALEPWRTAILDRANRAPNIHKNIPA